SNITTMALVFMLPRRRRPTWPAVEPSASLRAPDSEHDRTAGTSERQPARRRRPRGQVPPHGDALARQPAVGVMMRMTGVPFGPTFSGKNTRWVAGSTATECAAA